MTPVIVHQEVKYTQDLHYNIPKEWLVHNTPSRYMDRDIRTKEIMNSKTVCGANKLNSQILFYDGHCNRAIHILRSHHIKPFILKLSDSGNDHPNDNGPYLNLKGLYDQAIMNWQRHRGTLKFKNTHM